jgi:hypothetical protein
VQIRHGDLLLERVESTEGSGSRRTRGLVLARGEATGHAHTLRGAVEVLDGPVAEPTRIRLAEPTVLDHQEHAPLLIPAGEWVIRRQSEWVSDPAGGPQRAWSRVAD